jgi:diguanylate cyclase (GGDEF)-like protein
VTRSALDRILAVLCAVYVAALAASIAAAITGFATVDKVSGPVMVVFGFVAVGFAVRAARHPRLDRRTRLGWRVVAGAFVLALATPLLFLLVTGARPFPQPGDGTHLAFALVLAVGLQLFPLHAASRRDRWKTVLDATNVAAGASMLLWYVVIGPALEKTEDSAALVIAASAYPVVDLLVLFGFARVLLRGTDRSTRRPLRILAVGMLALYVGDAYLGYMQAHEETVQRTAWQFVCWLTMHFLLAAGAVEQCRQANAPARGLERRGDVAAKLPYFGIGLGYGLMAVAAIHEARAYPWLGLVLGGMVITGVVVLRQSLSQRDSAEAAATDTLTGLANRARLSLVLARGLERAARSGHRSAVLLIDLNGFKQINDTLGHQVGDGLLTAVAEAMRRCVRGNDLIGRLGGDEFAVVLPVVGGDEDVVAVAQRITDALAEPMIVGDQPLQASASIGAAISEPGELTPDALLHRADVAMYGAKRGRRRQAELWTAALQDAADGSADLVREG